MGCKVEYSDLLSYPYCLPGMYLRERFLMAPLSLYLQEKVWQLLELVAAVKLISLFYLIMLNAFGTRPQNRFLSVILCS
jgi:hypothetical protein